MATQKNQAEPNSTLASVIEQVADIIAEKETIYERLAQGRMLARSLVNMGQCDKEQREWVNNYLPLKQRSVKKSDDTAAAATEPESATTAAAA